jgi:hypothetical protein
MFNIAQIWILYILESPKVSTATAPPHSVNWTATYRSDSDVATPNQKWAYYNPDVRSKPQSKNYAKGKTKHVAWFASNCSPSNNRTGYVSELKNFIDVDVYGSCGDKTCDRGDVKCDELLDNDYKFYLAFENANCKDYITEKFFVNGLM